MLKNENQIPVYSLDQFRHIGNKDTKFQVEIFDTKRHFKVKYPHRHDFYEVLYLSGGSGFHVIDNNKYEIKPPCVFFLSPGQAHMLELSNDIRGYIFLFSAEFYQLNQKNKNQLINFPFFFSIEQQNPPLYLNNSKDEEFIRSLFFRGCNEMVKERYSESIIRSLLELILLICNELYPEQYEITPLSKGHSIVKKFLVLIEENYQQNLRVNDYADRLAITPNHLTQIVKNITGKTTIEILKDKNILEIKRLLLHTSLTISEISEQLNFSDQSYFTKYFKKITGVTPQQFRSQSVKST